MRYNKSVDEYFDEFKCLYLDNFEACVNILCDPYRYSSLLIQKIEFKQKSYTSFEMISMALKLI
jgi:hypothetical protein